MWSFRESITYAKHNISPIWVTVSLYHYSKDYCGSLVEIKLKGMKGQIMTSCQMLKLRSLIFTLNATKSYLKDFTEQSSAIISCVTLNLFALCVHKKQKWASKNSRYHLQHNNQNVFEGPLIIFIFFCFEFDKGDKNLQIIAQSLTQSSNSLVADIQSANYNYLVKII